MNNNRNGNPARGRGQANQGRGRGRSRTPRANPPAPPPPAPPPVQPRGGTATSSKRSGKNGRNVKLDTYATNEQTVATHLEKFAASFVTAGEARILPTPTPNYANAMAFHKVVPIAGDTGAFSGVYNRMFILDPYRPWTEGLTIIDEKTFSGNIAHMESELSNGHDFTVHTTISLPLELVGTDANNDTVTITAELRHQEGSGIYAWNAQTGRLEEDSFYDIPGIRFQTAGVAAEDNKFVAIIGDQRAATGGLYPQFFNTGTSTWSNIAGSTIGAPTYSNSFTQFTSNPGTTDGINVDGRIRVLLTVTNAADLGTIRSFSCSARLSNVTYAHLATQALPLCSQADLSEVKDVWDKSSHVRLGGMAFWLESTAAGLTNGGSVLAAQVLKSTNFSRVPSIAFSQLSELPDRVYVGKFKDGAYGWYNPDRILDLEFKPPSSFQRSVSESASVMVVIVKPENLANAGQSYLFKVNSNYNYRWQSRVFKPVLTPCSWELLRRLLIVNASYCNVGCNPTHVEKLRDLCRDFASNPENRRIAMDVLRMMKPGLKGLANGMGETFIPGYNILKGAIEPYL